MRLSDLQHDQQAVITKVKGEGAFRKRILEMGFVKGQKISIIKGAPLKDPIQYSIMGYEVSLRKSEASLIEIVPLADAHLVQKSDYQGVLSQDFKVKPPKAATKEIEVVLIGNPNCGKTTLFNVASSSRAKVGNYSGVTIDTHASSFQQDGYQFNLTDLPGTYSLSAYTPEELFVRKHLINEVPDVVINVIDASNLERNLYLTTQLIDMGVQVIIALNMYDELEKKGVEFDYQKLGKMIGVPIIPTTSTKGVGVKELFKKVIQVHQGEDPFVRQVKVNYGQNIEKSIEVLQGVIEQQENKLVTDKIASRFLSVKLIEGDKEAQKTLEACSNWKAIEAHAKEESERLTEETGVDGETLITDAKYGFIAGALKTTYLDDLDSTSKKPEGIDRILTHRLWGFPIFIFFMWVMFQSTFTIGSYPMDWIDALVGLLGDSIGSILGPGMLRDLLVDGVIGGVGGVIIFLPNILILFFFISLMEDTGYIARAAFIMDKLMHFLGLHGKSFIPLIMGFGCNVPAVMATRTLESRNNRLLTMLINPFMSCSARLPVYLLLIGAFFQDNPGMVLFSMYLIGILLSIVMAIIFKKTLFKLEEVPFVMELPPYRIPTAKSIVRHMWEKAFQYLKKMGGVILIASVIIWALGYFPREINFTKEYDELIQQVELNTALEKEAKIKLISQLERSKESERFEGSYIGKIGHFVEPVIRPLGFDWKMGVSLITGMAAKELVVSTMGVLYQTEVDLEDPSGALVDKLQTQEYQYGNKRGEKVFSPLIAFAFMLFILIYFPCVAVIAAIKKESGGWKWAVFTMLYTTGLAYLLSFVVYQVGSLVI